MKSKTTKLETKNTNKRLSLLKEMPHKSAMRKTKTLQKYHLIHLVMDMGLHLNVVCIPCKNSLENTIVSFAINLHFEIVCEFWVGACVYIPSLCWSPFCIRSVQAPCMLPQSVWVHMLLRHVMSWRPCFLGVFHLHCLLKSFPFWKGS